MLFVADVILLVVVVIVVVVVGIIVVVTVVVIVAIAVSAVLIESESNNELRNSRVALCKFIMHDPKRFCCWLLLCLLL